MLIYLWPELALNAAKLSPASPLSYRAPILALLSAALILADRVSFFNTGATEGVTAKVGLLELDSVNIEVKERSFLCFLMAGSENPLPIGQSFGYLVGLVVGFQGTGGLRYYRLPEHHDKRGHSSHTRGPWMAT